MIEITGLTKTYTSLGKPPVEALKSVDVTIPTGASVGLVGESGSGKSTLLRCLMRLERADSGSIVVDGTDVLTLPHRRLGGFRQQVQMVFQDPMGSLNPRMTIGASIEEGMIVHKRLQEATKRAARVGELLEMVGLNPDHRDRHPGAFSGGQRQRVAIARALSVEPSVLICDEPVSALDVSVQAQVLNLLRDMSAELGLSLFFVAHDLAVVRYLCPDIYVMNSGAIVEHASRDELFDSPVDPYTRQLIDAIPENDALRPASDYLIPPTQKMEA